MSTIAELGGQSNDESTGEGCRLALIKVLLFPPTNSNNFKLSLHACWFPLATNGLLGQVFEYNMFP